MAEGSGWGDPDRAGRPGPDHGAGNGKPWFPPAADGPGNGGPKAGPYGQWGTPPPPYGYPGYGQPPGWQPAAPKPGVIPLRPVGVSEILDGAFTAIRRNPRATLGVGAIIMTVYGILAAVIAPAAVTGFSSFTRVNAWQPASQAQIQRQPSDVGHQVLGLVLIYLLLYVAGQILSGMLTNVIGPSVLGERITAGEAWHRTLPRLPAMFGATLLFAAVIIGIWAVYAGIGAAIVAIGNGTGPVSVVYFVLAGMAGICLTVWLWTSFMLANQVVVLERTGPVRALGRSWRLVRRSFWRVFGVTLLAQLIVGIASAILQLPFTIPASLMAAHSGDSLHPPIAAVVIGTVGTIASRTLTGALLAGVYVLLYVDLRMRKEGLDIALRTATGGERPPGDEFATLWRPPGGSSPGPG